MFDSLPFTDGHPGVPATVLSGAAAMHGTAAESRGSTFSGDVLHDVVVIGGGPAGLSAAYELTKHEVRPCVLEAGDQVGGLARTENYKGNSFDMGGHRFFTKSAPVAAMWQEVLGSEFLKRPRLSRIYYRRKYFHYPLKPLECLFRLGPWECLRILCSYLRWTLFPGSREDTFEQWVTNRFGKRLFETFFRAYTEKVWGISCSELKSEWAAQRIKDLSLKSALLNMFWRGRGKIRSLIEEFHYPRLGPGMMWKAVQERIERQGGQVRLNNPVTRLLRIGNRVVAVETGNDVRREQVRGAYFISSMPVTTLVRRLDPPAPPAVVNAAARLKYRDFLTVCLIVRRPNLFPDNWIYVHDPEVKVGRIQNFKNWSPDMVADPATTSLGMEYFCTEGDAFWSQTDGELIELAKRELAFIGLSEADDVVDGCVYRVPKAYPIYDSDYQEHLQVVRRYVETLENVVTVGRNGQHRYNNQDHSVLTGMVAAHRFLFGGDADAWDVNADAEYHEELRRSNENESPPFAAALRASQTRLHTE